MKLVLTILLIISVSGMLVTFILNFVITKYKKSDEFYTEDDDSKMHTRAYTFNQELFFMFFVMYIIVSGVLSLLHVIQ